MHKRTLLLLLTTLLSAYACAEEEDCSFQEPTLAELRLLLKSSPYELARREAKLEKPRFYGILGYGRTVVGIDDNLINCALQNGQVKDMPGTSDYMCTAEISNLRPSAQRFAETYNLELAKLIRLDCH